ncbi:hypothetical protein A4H97_04735 [Niastella yeongjuensis]|uniref:Uncharacterized protein n=1 Tax=Niastella yeongjuensis TaxID=354355 RepID=A0A1V9ELA8_9BACT|nr:hypothetical protein [Niastella yeongjuensis]OQP46832.1 hypothetical protein A4H97_04735 [Niastella yeongjuensis]SEN56351.1 hypothetical protein SAMN05660816_00970 [Niastella yeongjuensis]
MNTSEFDENVVYTLRIELLDGKSLLYAIDAENKQYLINNLRLNADGSYQEDKLSFLWFETTYNRQVVINVKSIVRVLFGVDPAVTDYRDNFQVGSNPLPQAIVYHTGNTPENNSQKTPLLYFSLNEGCLASFELELEGKQRLRQFINLIDENGEESFIPMVQIMVMEFDQQLFYGEEEEYEEEE